MGMLASRARWITCRRRALPSGSGPPSRTAMAISRPSFVNIWPRLTSAAPFCRLICDHLECPDTIRPLGTQEVWPYSITGRATRSNRAAAVTCRSRGSVAAIAGGRRHTWPKKERQDNSRDEPADVRPEGHAARLLGAVGEGAEARDELRDKPEPDQEHGGDARQEDDRPQEHERPHLRAAEDHKVGAQDAGDGAAGADARDPRGGINRYLRQPGDEAAHQVEDQIADVAEGVLDVVPEHPEIDHVRRNVQEAPVQEHRGEERQVNVAKRRSGRHVAAG